MVFLSTKPKRKSSMNFRSSTAKRQAISDDLSRLLDPQYSPQPRTNSLHHLSLIRDQHGDFHDPDYRPFTPISRPTSPRRHPSPRPYWESISMTEDELLNVDEDDDACDERRLSDGYAYSSIYAHRRSSAQYRRDHQRYNHTYTIHYTPSYPCYSPSSFADSSSPPTSYDSEATVFGDEPFGEKEKLGWTGVLRRKRKEKGKETVNEETREDDEQELYESAPVPVPEPVPTPKREEYTPTCGDVFQRHWQTVRLAFNLSVFRAQRRMKRRVHSLMSIH